MLRRRREYYVGGRPRRRSGRLALVGLALVAVVGAAALASNLPALGLGTGSSGAPRTTQTAPPVALGSASPAPPSTVPGSSDPGAGATPSGSPAPSGPPPCAGPTDVIPARVVSHGSIHEKTVALTFDDGLDPQNTARILRILEQFKVNATFFPTGRSMERFEKVWRAIDRANYPIANHTYDHIELKGECFDVQRRELAHAASVFDAQKIRPFPAMRPPYELFDDVTARAAAAEGLQAVVLWNIDTRDWQGASVATIRQLALHGGRGSIILMHTFPENTAVALPSIIRGYRERGFEFVTIGQMLDIDGPVPFPAPEP